MIDPGEARRFSIPPDIGASSHATRPVRSLVVTHPCGAAAGATPESLLAIAWQNRWTMLVCVVLVVAAGFIYVQKVTPIYTSTSRLYLDYVRLPREIASDVGQTPETERYLYTQIGLLKSRPVVAAAAEKIAPQRLRTFKKVDVPVEFIRKEIDVEVGRRDEIISVSFNSPYPVDAAHVVNSVVEAYMDSRSEHEQRNSAQVLNILKEDMKRVNEEITTKRQELRDFQKNLMPLALGSDEGGGVMQAYLEVQTAFMRAQIASSEAESLRRGVKALAGHPDALRQYMHVTGRVNSYIDTSSEEAPLRARLAELALQIREQSEKLAQDHPKVIALAGQKAELESILAQFDDQTMAEAVDAAEQFYADAKEHEERIAALYDEQQERVVGLNAEVVQYQALRSELDRLVTYAQTLEQQVREIGRIVGEDVGQLRIAILEPAQPADKPSSPQKAKIMTLALLLGLFLGGGTTGARVWLDQRLRSTDEISAAFGLPVLGTIPAMSHRQKVQARGQKVFLQPDSHEAEAFRTVRTAIFFGAPRDKMKTFLVTSPASGDGKSTLVSNLAIAMASAGQKTLVLDADLRKPTQHLIFEADPPDRCLEGVLRGKIPLRTAIRETDVKGLSLLSCGQGFANPAEVLNSPRFARLLEHLAKVYDRVLVDAPPVTVVTDAQILGAICDLSILVVNVESTTRKTAQRAIEALRRVNAQLLGVIVNNVNASGHGYGYYGRYGRPYGSGSNGEGSKLKRAGGNADGSRSRAGATATNAR